MIVGDSSKIIKHKSVVFALLLPPIAAVFLREAGIISLIAEEWISSTLFLLYIIVMGIYHARELESRPK